MEVFFCERCYSFESFSDQYVRSENSAHPYRHYDITGKELFSEGQWDIYSRMITLRRLE
jgi:hypothetical protein